MRRGLALFELVTGWDATTLDPLDADARDRRLLSWRDGTRSEAWWSTSELPVAVACTDVRRERVAARTGFAVDDAALPPAVDLELAGTCADRPAQADVDAEVAIFLDLVEDAWQRPVVLYVGGDWETIYPTRDSGSRAIWQLTFPRRPAYDTWWIWQLHGYGRVDGIAGRVDLDVMGQDQPPG